MTVEIERGRALAKLTTIGVGGPAAAFARPRTSSELADALAFARGEELAVVVVGLGSNFLASDDGVEALVLRLEGELAAVEVDRGRIVAGGGATNAVCLHRARDAGLGGFEFACAIPGTAGGGVRMNAGAYGRDWQAIVLRALVVGQVVAQVEFQLVARPVAEIRETVAAVQARRKETQPTNKRTFGSVFKN